MTRFGLPLLCFLAAALSPQVAGATKSAELYTSSAYGYGRFEARVRFAAGDGVVSSFFLWKDGSDQPNTFWNELDYEKLGADCHVQTNALYGNPVADHSQKPTLSADLCSAFHVYAYEWTPDSIVWLVDGVEIRRETGATALAYAQNAAGGMQIHFNIWPGDATFGGNFSPGILPVHQYIDWAQFSSYANGAFTVAWRENFDAATVPSGWLTGNWASPKNLSTHDPRNVSFIGGYAVLSLTADDATGPAGAMPEGVGGTGGAAGATGTAGTAGATNSGGMAGTSTAGGASAAGQTSTGGGTSKGGDTSAAGTASSAGGVAGAGGGAAGATISVGGAAATSGFVGRGAPATKDASGCSCRVAGPTPQSPNDGSIAAFIIIALSGVVRRRRDRVTAS